MSLLGHGFGTVPMGTAQVAARAGCCGDPGDCAGPCSTSSSTPFCICDLELLALEISDVRCPRHGLVRFLMETFA